MAKDSPRKLKLRQARCLGKVKHKSFTSAEYVLYLMRNNNELEIYKCSFCKDFHIGHKISLFNREKAKKQKHQNKLGNTK